MKRTTIDSIRVFARPGKRQRGRLVAGNIVLPCALGRSGPVHAKREGDGASPIGRFRLGALFYRADKGPRPRTQLPVRRIGRHDGWCDDPADRRYNRPIALPDRARHEEMWRSDDLYDVVVDIRCNRGPIRRGRGSAIFLHLAGPDFGPTAGCVAIAPAARRRLLALLGPRTTITIR